MVIIVENYKPFISFNDESSSCQSRMLADTICNICLCNGNDWQHNAILEINNAINTIIGIYYIK